MSPHAHLFETGEHGPHLLVVDGSQVFGLGSGLAGAFAAANEAETAALLSAHGLNAARFLDTAPPEAVPLRALSLAVSGRCNLGCVYCYAEGGDFGRAAREMSPDVAEAAIRGLIAGAAPGERVNLSFLGGEPLTNRRLIRAATELAARLAEEAGVRVGFSLTTNGTLLEPEDGIFFDQHRFSITVSLDGVQAVHDALRPTKGGRGSYARAIGRIEYLLGQRGRFDVSARVTVTPRNLDLENTLDHFVGLGFDSVGFSPLLHAPAGSGEMADGDFDELLAQMIACGRAYERHTLDGRRYPFSNMTSALREIHRGTHRPYPCGAGAGYMGVSAEGRLHACHRFVGDEDHVFGDVVDGVDPARQRDWLARRHVATQAPCTSCWARHLCGGGCHYEVVHRGRPACGYIRGWLDYALGAYVRISAARPDLAAARL